MQYRPLYITFLLGLNSEYLFCMSRLSQNDSLNKFSNQQFTGTVNNDIKEKWTYIWQIEKPQKKSHPLSYYFYLNKSYITRAQSDKKDETLKPVQERATSQRLKFVPRRVSRLDASESSNAQDLQERRATAVQRRRDSQRDRTENLSSDVENTTYIGAVLEYEPYNHWTDEEKGYGILRRNAERLVQFASQAKNLSADILIAPEYGLQSLNMFPDDKDRFLTFTQYVPDPAEGLVPCDFEKNSDHFEAMKILSCGARNNRIYLVVCLAELLPCSSEATSMDPWVISSRQNCPKEGFLVYGSQVVFDRRGAVIARYRKQNLFLEDYFTPGPKVDASAIFVTDFDVVFSLQICFDILYKHPGYSNVKNKRIRDIAMSTAWADELPFDLAVSSQNGWSRGLGINLLVSGYHDPDNFKLGSGIFRSYSREDPLYTFDKHSGNVLIVSTVTTVRATANNSTERGGENNRVKISKPVYEILNNLDFDEDNLNRSHKIIYQNLSDYTRVLLTSGNDGQSLNVTVCSNDNFCCDLTYEYTGNLTYLFVVFSGQFPVGYGRYNLGIQQCGVVWCRNSDYKTCANIEGGFTESDTFGPFKITSLDFATDSLIPIGNQRNFSLIPSSNLNFELRGNEYSLFTSVPVNNCLVAALYGRWYERDS